MAASLGGPDAASFSITTAPDATVAPDGSTGITVRFAPGSLGAKSATLSIASNDADENPYLVTLSGTGVAPDIAVEQPVGSGVNDGGARAFGTLTAEILPFQQDR